MIAAINAATGTVCCARERIMERAGGLRSRVEDEEDECSQRETVQVWSLEFAEGKTCVYFQRGYTVLRITPSSLTSNVLLTISRISAYKVLLY